MKKTIKKEINPNDPACGLCGKKSKPRYKTECCGKWICDDDSDYAMFSYARNSCSRNHRRYTLCASHFAEEHKGDWKTCKKCYENYNHELEMYVWYGTNEYNFEILVNPPKFRPTHCNKCGKIISLSNDGYSTLCGAYFCEECDMSDEEREKIIKDYKEKNNDSLTK